MGPTAGEEQSLLGVDALATDTALREHVVWLQHLLVLAGAKAAHGKWETCTRETMLEVQCWLAAMASVRIADLGMSAERKKTRTAL